jgi:uncharacterized low-complexity protein
MQDRIGKGKARQGKAWQGKIGQGKGGQTDRAREDGSRAGQGRQIAKHGRAEQRKSNKDIRVTKF